MSCFNHPSTWSRGCREKFDSTDVWNASTSAGDGKASSGTDEAR